MTSQRAGSYEVKLPAGAPRRGRLGTQPTGQRKDTGSVSARVRLAPERLASFSLSQQLPRRLMLQRCHAPRGGP